VRATLSGIDPAVQGFFARTLTEHIAVSLLPVRLAAGLSFVVAVLVSWRVRRSDGTTPFSDT
jgi:hypothetical protein